VQTGTQGYFFVSGLQKPTGSWRLSWTDKAGMTFVSRDAKPQREPQFKG
jgi:hypothetical protein